MNIIKMNRYLYIIIFVISITVIILMTVIESYNDVSFVLRHNNIITVQEPMKTISITMPYRNIFDPTGNKWQTAQTTIFPAVIGHVEHPALSGFFHTEDVSGVFTGDRFVHIGEALGPDRLTAIGQGGAFVKGAGGTVELPIKSGSVNDMERYRVLWPRNESAPSTPPPKSMMRKDKIDRTGE